ncbi:MAG: hypothetical protein PUF12_04940 [Thermoflexaceae bacterium]|nr:hypothetical protein [Thermoflexaceae bacterium]
MSLSVILGLLVWGLGALLFYFSYFISKKMYSKQVSLYEEGMYVGSLNAQELYVKILNTGLFAPNSVQIIDDISVVICSGKYEFVFTIKDNILRYTHPSDLSVGWTNIHSILKEVVAANQLQDAIVGTLYGHEVKGNKQLYDNAMKGIKAFRIAIIAIIVGGLVFVFSLFDSMNNDYINVVKNRTVDGVQGTIGEHVDSFLANEKWKYFTTDDGDCMVEVSGMYGDYEILIQFRFEVSCSDSITSSTPFRLYYFSVDGIPYSIEEGSQVFREYILGN